MGSRTLFRRLLDANALAALGYCEHSELVFTSVGMTVTANCFKEIRSGKDDRTKRYQYRKGAEVAHRYLENRERYENLTLYPAPGSPPYNANNAGEKSIRIGLFEESQSFDTVVAYDNDVGPVLRPVRRSEISYDLFPPNEPLFFLYKKGCLTGEEFCATTANIIDDQGWDDSENVDLFWDFDVNCQSFKS